MSSATVASGLAAQRVRDRLLAAPALPTLAVAGLLVLVARRPEAVLRAEFYGEEANAFFVPTFFFDPVSLLVEPWGGYLQVLIRIGSQVLRLVPVYWAPLAENLLAFGAIIAVALFIAGDRLAGVIPDRRLRIAFGATLFILPAQGNVIGTFLNAQWYGALWLAMLPMASAPRTDAGLWIERLVAVLIGLSGPFSALFAPVYLWQLRSRRDARIVWLTAIVLVCGLVQATVTLTSGRADLTGERSGLDGFLTFALHAGIVPVLGARVSSAVGVVGIPTWLLIAGGAIIAILAMLTVARSIPARALPFVYGALVTAASGVAIHIGSGIWAPGVNERYFLLVATLVAAAVMIGVVRRQLPAIVLAGLLAIGILTDFRLTPHPTQHWETAHACIGQSDPCVIPIWPREYDVRWPGSGGFYVMPEFFDP